MNCILKNVSSLRKGSVSLETAISFSIVLIFITGIISVAAFLRTDILMQRAVSESTRDISHFMPFSVIASDMISTFTNALPDSVDDNGEFTRIGSVMAGIDGTFNGALRAGAMNALIGRSFADDLAYEYNEYNGSEFFGPDDIYVDFDIEDYYIKVYVLYSVNTIIGPVQRQIVSSVSFYGDFELFLSADETESDGSDIWSQNNFERGTYFADRYGANLPHTFPVINYNYGGNIGSIVSIDLNKPTYSSAAFCIMRVTREVDDLASFDGADVTLNGSRYVVKDSDIISRTLIVVIPEDSPETTASAVSTVAAYAASRGVTLQLEQFGYSG